MFILHNVYSIHTYYICSLCKAMRLHFWILVWKYSTEKIYREIQKSFNASYYFCNALIIRNYLNILSNCKLLLIVNVNLYVYILYVYIVYIIYIQICEICMHRYTVFVSIIVYEFYKCIKNIVKYIILM